MTTIWAFLLAIAILVAFHEYGHYLVARLAGVKVLRFSIGFGKVLYARKFAGGETEWVISAIPLGGYVKMLDEREGEVAPEELHRAFNRQPVLKRMAIVVAGPLANLLLAVFFYWVLFVQGVPGMKPILGEIPAGTAASSAQLHKKQQIINVNGNPVLTWQDVRWGLMDNVLQSTPASLVLQDAQGEQVQRVLDTGTLTAADLDSDFLAKLGLQPYRPAVKPVVGKVVPGGAAERAGIQEGDDILSANGTMMTDWSHWVEVVRSHPGEQLHLVLKRSGREVRLDITPETVSEDGKKIGKVGLGPQIDQKELDALMTVVSYGPAKALLQSVHKTWDTCFVSLQMMWRMVLGQVSLKNLSGPLTIADYAGQSAQMGVGAYLSFLALISISLGVLNLLPIPLLDGGHLLYYVAELLKGSPVPERLWEAGQKLGIVLLFALMALALFNDVSRYIFN